MATYYVSKLIEQDGSHHVHTSRCVFLPRDSNSKVALGPCKDGTEAVLESRKIFEKTKGCFFCNFEANLNLFGGSTHLMQKTSK